MSNQLILISQNWSVLLENLTNLPLVGDGLKFARRKKMARD